MADHQADHFNVSVNIKIGRIIEVKAEHSCTIFPFVMILYKEDLKRIVRFFSSIHKPQTFWTNKKREWFQFCWSLLCNIRAEVIIYQLDGVVRTAPIHKKGKNKSSWTKRWWWRDAQRTSQQTNKQHKMMVMKQTSQQKKEDDDKETNKQTKWCSSAHCPDP